jgi:uncharacterized tellurite resistance protein B-like protein
MKPDPCFLDKLSGHIKNPLTPKSALFLAALTVISADGKIVNAETADLDKIMRGGDEADFDLAYKTYTSHPYEECVDLVAGCLNDQQQVALIAILLDLAMADGILAIPEEKLISAYVLKFGVPAKVFRELCHYTCMKNNFSLFGR